ncbi:MAG: double zinc ribbon domain-containing protein [Gaiellaceae bacterium]
MRALDVLFPERCAICSAPGRMLCAACRHALIRLSPPVCERCGSPSAWPVRRCAECSGRRLAFARARSAIVYDARARALVREWKERGRRELAREAALLVVDVIAEPEVEAIVPVPGDPERAWKRGDVAPDALARALAELWSASSVSLLRRTHSRPRQRGLALVERRRNVRRSVVATAPAPRTVCVVDDVYTSGATADACASALRRAGAKRVEVVTFARAVR